MADRDTYQNNPDRWGRPRRDDEGEYGWSSGGEGRNFSDSDAGAPFGTRRGWRAGSESYRNEAYRGESGGRGYGGQGAYGQGPSPGGYGYGRAIQPEDRAGRGHDPRRDPDDYAQGGTGGYGWYGADRQGDPWSGGGRHSRPEGRYDERGADRERRRDNHEPHYRRWRDAQLDAHDQEYARWRETQARRYDDDYGQWRDQRHEAFARDFESWRSGRGKDQPKTEPTELTVSPPQVENVTDGEKPSEDRHH